MSQDTPTQTTEIPEHWTDESSMALCAIRYTIGRRSYIVGDGCKWALRYGRTSKPVRRTVIRDLEAEFERAERCSPEHHPLGFESDVRAWRSVLDQLKVMEASGT